MSDNIKIRPWELAQEVVDLRAENAALRETLKFAADAYDEEKAGGELIHRLYEVSRKARAVLAARKEAQP